MLDCVMRYLFVIPDPVLDGSPNERAEPVTVQERKHPDNPPMQKKSIDNTRREVRSPHYTGEMSADEIGIPLRVRHLLHKCLYDCYTDKLYIIELVCLIKRPK